MNTTLASIDLYHTCMHRSIPHLHITTPHYHTTLPHSHITTLACSVTFCVRLNANWKQPGSVSYSLQIERRRGGPCRPAAVQSTESRSLHVITTQFCYNPTHNTTHNTVHDTTHTTTHTTTQSCTTPRTTLQCCVRLTANGEQPGSV